MGKPITVAKNEFDEALVELVNNSGLPAFIVRSALRDLDSALAQLEQTQLKADQEAWKKGDEEES